MSRALALFAALLLVPIGGFFLFLAEVQASTSSKPEKADAIVALSGDPRRSVVAVDLLKKGFGSYLIIVGQDNQHEVDLLRRDNPLLFACCVKVDHSSTNTAQDAHLVRKLISTPTPNSLLLVTSSFHIPRARNELANVLPGTRITGVGIPDEFYRPAAILSNSDVASAFVRQYLMYIGSWIPNAHRQGVAPALERGVLFLSDITHLAVLAILVLTSLFLMFAAFRHRRRHLGPSHRRLRSGSRPAK